MNGELPPFKQMHIKDIRGKRKNDKNGVLSHREQTMVSKLIQAGIAAKVLLSQIDDDIHLQKSIAKDSSQIIDFLENNGYIAKKLSKKTIEQAREILKDSLYARDFFAEKNLGLVNQRAGKRIRMKGYSPDECDEIKEEGKLGLMTAIDKFDPSLGYLFSTPASYWIDQSILSFIDSKTKLIKMPTHMNSLYRNIQYAKKELREQYHDDADITDELIVKWLADHNRLISKKPITLEDVQKARILRKETISYEVGNEENDADLSLIDTIESGERIEENVISQVGAMDSFNALLSLVEDHRKREILRDWYTSSEDQELVVLSNVSRKHCLTKERVKQLKYDAEEEIKRKLTEEKSEALGL